MNKIFYKIRKSRARISTLSVLTASIILSATIFCALCMERVQDSQYVSPPKEMKKGEVFNCSPFAPVELTIEDINSDGESCLIGIKSLKYDNETIGWVKNGENISFVPDLPDSTKIYIGETGKDNVYVIVQYGKGGYKYRFRWPWHYLE